MALEAATNAAELVATNPTPTDLLKSTDDHIRMLKRILKDGFQGHFTSLTVVRALTAVDGSWFTYNGAAYTIFTSTLEENLPFIIKLDNDKVGIRYATTITGKEALMPTAATQRRYPRVEQLSGTAFDSAAANAAFDGTPIAGDFVIVLGTDFVDARVFTTSWQSVDILHGGFNALAGTLSALMVMSPLGLFEDLRVKRIEMLSATHLEVISPETFGPDNLRYWFGLNANVIDGNGKIAYNALSKTNALEWKSLTTGTTNGNSTPVDGGAVVNNLGMASAYTCLNETYNSQSAYEEARIALGVDGTFSVLAYGDVTAGTPVSGAYVTTPSNSTGFLYEVKFEKLSGGTVYGATNVWQQINAPREVSVSASRATPGSDSTTASIKIYVRKIGDAASEKTQTVSLTATATSNAGSIP